MRKISKIIIHCSATPEGKDFTVQQIRQWHTTPKPKGNGWRDIGYHFVIYRDSSVHPGRPVEQIGAHTSGHNANSIGVCYIGGCAHDGKTPKDTRTPAQRAALIRLVAELLRQYPAATVHGHCHHHNSCDRWPVIRFLSKTLNISHSESRTFFIIRKRVAREGSSFCFICRVHLL